MRTKRDPNRACRMCAQVDEEPRPMEELLAVAPKVARTIDLGYGNERVFSDSLDELRSAAGNCPACMLATLSQSGIQEWEVGFDFKKECEAFKAIYLRPDQRMG